MASGKDPIEATKIAEFIAQAETPIEAYNIFRMFRTYMRDWKFVLASEKGPRPGFAVNKTFTSGAAVRSLFASEHVLCIDDITITEMDTGEAKVPIDFSISLDTQAFSYIRPYLDDMQKSLPPDIEEVMQFIAKPDVNVDPLPYFLENHNIILNGTQREKDKIFESMLAYEVLRTVDKEFLESTGRIRSYLSDEDRRAKALHLISNSAYTHSQEFFSEAILKRQRMMYCILLKMAEVQIRKKRASFAEKIFEFVAFLDRELATMFARESILASRYFQVGQNFGFFGKIQANSACIFANLKNMAWDLWHIRQCEEGLLFKHLEDARYYFPAILTFDKRLIEVMNLCPLKMCVFTPEHTIQPVYAADPIKKVAGDSDEIAAAIYKEFYSESARNSRELRREDLRDTRTLESLIARLELELAKTAQVEKH